MSSSCACVCVLYVCVCMFAMATTSCGWLHWHRAEPRSSSPAQWRCVACFPQAQPLNIAPRRPNFDLKRDVARKMQRLNVRTQLAIADLIRAC